MKRGRKEKSHETSLSASRLRHGRISTGEINIPLDLTVEILKKLPAKSLVRFQCVSKLWSSTIGHRKDFIDSIVSRSLSQPPRDAHVFLNPDNDRECFLVISSSCPRNTHKESVSIGATLKSYVRGLFLCWSSDRQEGAIYNPTTRQFFNLPKTKASSNGVCLFGYDPLGDQYKVLFLPDSSGEQVCQVLTLGDPKEKQWRNIQGSTDQCPFSSLPLGSEVSINGAIFFRESTRSRVNDTSFEHVYQCFIFDVRSEKFYHVDPPKEQTPMNQLTYLIRYQGKLGFISREKGVEIWVKEEDAEKKTQRWSKIFSYEMDGFDWTLSDVTRGGEIVFINEPDDMFRIFYYDPKRNSVRYVDLQDSYPKERGLNKYPYIRTFADYVENTMCLF